MKKNVTLWGGVTIATMALIAVSGALTPGDALAKGKPKPPPCDCPEEIETPLGPCVLVDCGFDCVYVCPFPG